MRTLVALLLVLAPAAAVAAENSTLVLEAAGTLLDGRAFALSLDAPVAVDGSGRVRSGVVDATITLGDATIARQVILSGGGPRAAGSGVLVLDVLEADGGPSMRLALRLAGAAGNHAGAFTMAYAGVGGAGTATATLG